MATQTLESKQAVIAAWEASEYFPRNPLLLQTDHNIQVLLAESNTIPVLTIENLAAAIERLTQQGKLEYAAYVEPVAAPFVLRNPDTGAPITTRDELSAFVNLSPKNTRRLLYSDNGKKSVEAETEFNRLLSQPSTPNPEKAAQRAAKENADKWGIRRMGSDKTELDRKTPTRVVEETANDRNVTAANQNAARIALESVIDQQTVNSPSGRVNHTATHQLKEKLRAIRVVNTGTMSVDYVATLQAVTAEIKKQNR